jgi:hypothetical protein
MASWLSQWRTCEVRQKMSMSTTLTKRQISWKKWYERNRERRLIYNRNYNRNYYQINKSCRLAVSRKYNKEHPHHNKSRTSKQYICHNYTQRNRQIRESICELCNSARELCAHHIDYNYPEIIVTLCKSCHNWIHHNKEN